MSSSRPNVLKLMKFGAITILVCLLCFFSATGAVSQSQLPSEIKVGIRTFVPPIGRYSMQAGVEKYEGFCSLFGQYLENYLRIKYPSLKIKVSYQVIENEYKKPPFDRYAGLKMGKVHIECGPNSRSSIFKDIIFSDSFYEPEIKLLLKKDLAAQINNFKRDISSLYLGVIRDTTILEQLSNSGKTNVGSIKVYDTIEQVLEDLNNGVIEAYVSDEIILRSILEERRSKDYAILPQKNYLTNKNEQYAMAIYERTPYSTELIEIINQVLENPNLKDEEKKLKQYEDGEDGKDSFKYPPFGVVTSPFENPKFGLIAMEIAIVFLGLFSLIYFSLPPTSRPGFVNELCQAIINLFKKLSPVFVEVIKRIFGGK